MSKVKKVQDIFDDLREATMTAMANKPKQTVAPNVRILDEFVTTGYLQRFFNRSSLTILQWRANKGLPYVRIPGDSRDTIRYIKDEVITWAKAEGVDMFPDQMLLDSKKTT